VQQFWCKKEKETLSYEIEERFPRCLQPDELEEDNDFLIRKRIFYSFYQRMKIFMNNNNYFT
jgi:hypothetical protein